MASLLPRRKNNSLPLDARTNNIQRRFLVIIPAYQEDSVIVATAEAAVGQDYPSALYHVVVVSDHQKSDTNRKLSVLPLTLLQPTFEKSSKGRALQYAIQHSGSNYDRVVILDADNIVPTHFLSQLDNLYHEGHRVIQCHRTAKNSSGDIAILDGISEEINNAIFRKGHNRIGLSSALIGSGMCFEAKWFCSHIGKIKTAGEDRELEKMLFSERLHVYYAEHIDVLDEKVSTGDNFEHQRLRWLSAQLQSLLDLLPGLPKALFHGNINYLDKTLQQMLLPRSVLLILLPLLAVGISFFSLQLSAKWWLLCVVLYLAILVSIPKRYYSWRVVLSLRQLPGLVWRMLRNLMRLDRHNRNFTHTQHSEL